MQEMVFTAVLNRCLNAVCGVVIARQHFAVCPSTGKGACPCGVWNRRYTVPAHLSCCLGDPLHDLHEPGTGGGAFQPARATFTFLFLIFLQVRAPVLPLFFRPLTRWGVAYGEGKSDTP